MTCTGETVSNLMTNRPKGLPASILVWFEPFGVYAKVTSVVACSVILGLDGKSRVCERDVL